MYVVVPTVTVDESERGWGSAPVTVAVGIETDPVGPGVGTAWTVATVVGDPPPNVTSFPSMTAPDASWRPAFRFPTCVSVPEAVSSV
jgi:hypothetical protein